MKVMETAARKPITILDPNYENKVRESFVHQGCMHALGGELVKIGPGFIEIHLPFTAAAQQQHGFFHGGIVATVADSVSGYATYTVLPPDEECVSAEFKINFLYPAKGSKLIGRGGIIKVGRTLVIAEATVSIIKDNGEEVECAVMMHTLSRVKHFRSTK